MIKMKLLDILLICRVTKIKITLIILLLLLSSFFIIYRQNKNIYIYILYLYINLLLNIWILIDTEEGFISIYEYLYSHRNNTNDKFPDISSPEVKDAMIKLKKEYGD